MASYISVPRDLSKVKTKVFMNLTKRQILSMCIRDRQRMVDREAKRAEGKGVGYDRWAAKHNLKQMAATVTAYQQYGFSSPEELDLSLIHL